MLAAFDIDGVITAEPEVIRGLMSALKAAGHEVVVITGCGEETPDTGDPVDKAAYLKSLGFSACYDQLVVVGDPTDELKAEWLKDHHADLLVDNSKANAKAAAGVCLVLVPWQSRV